MTNVEVVESLKYGFKLFAYLLGVVVLGGGGMVLGAALAGPELLNGGTDNLSSPELLGGLVLGILGVVIWFTGLFGLTYKLLADAVQWGVASGRSPVPAEQEASGQPTQSAIQRAAEPVGPSPGEQTAREFGPESTVPGAANVSDRRIDGTTAATTESAPETTAGGTEGTDTGEPAEQPTAESDSSQRPSSVKNEPPETDEQPEMDEQPEAREPAASKQDSVDESAETAERTAEQIAFGADKEGQSARRTGNDESPSQEEGTIPSYEAMDESQSGSDDESDNTTPPYETSDSVPGDSTRSDSAPGNSSNPPTEESQSADTESADQFSETPSTASERSPDMSPVSETDAEESAIPFDSAGTADRDEDSDTDESDSTGKNEAEEKQTDPLSDPLDEDR